MQKSEFTTIKKSKIFNISLNIAHFSKIFLTEPHSYLYNILCKSHGFLISRFESGNIFLKMWLFRKIHLVILFWTRSCKIFFLLPSPFLRKKETWFWSLFFLIQNFYSFQDQINFSVRFLEFLILMIRIAFYFFF